MHSDASFKSQIKRNLIALLSLAIALSALTYNSWRNEQSESNRNIRAAGFEIMREAAKLQFLIDTATYSMKQQDEYIIQGWVSVNLINALSDLVSPAIKAEAIELKSLWQQHSQLLSDSQQANAKLSASLNEYVELVKVSIQQLN